MPTTAYLERPSARVVRHAPAADIPVDIIAALLDALTSPDRFTIVEHGGELTIVPALSEAVAG